VEVPNAIERECDGWKTEQHDDQEYPLESAAKHERESGHALKGEQKRVGTEISPRASARGEIGKVRNVTRCWPSRLKSNANDLCRKKAKANEHGGEAVFEIAKVTFGKFTTFNHEAMQYDTEGDKKAPVLYEM